MKHIALIILLFCLAMSCSCALSCKPCVCDPVKTEVMPPVVIQPVAECPQVAEVKTPSCIKEKTIAPVTNELPNGRKTITISITSDPQLNIYKDLPHPLFLCFYQLKEPNAFKQMADEEGGVAKLMECGRFDPSVVYTKRLVVQPDKVIADVRDRAEGVRYLGVVAGYYNFQKEGVIRLYPIPPSDNESFSIHLDLGPRQIQMQR